MSYYCKCRRDGRFVPCPSLEAHRAKWASIINPWKQGMPKSPNIVYENLAKIGGDEWDGNKPYDDEQPVGLGYFLMLHGIRNPPSQLDIDGSPSSQVGTPCRQ